MTDIRALLAAALVVIGIAGQTAAQDYRIRPGDVLQVEVLEDQSLNRDLLVLPDGRISLPLAGTVRAGGRTLSQVEADLTAALAPNFAAQPNVFVGISRLADPQEAPPTVVAPPAAPVTIDVYVLGEAQKPGQIAVPPGTTVLQLFARMGGFTSFAATKRVQLRRTDPATGVENIYVLNYEAIQSGRSPNGRVALLPGDVILVPERGLFE